MTRGSSSCQAFKNRSCSGLDSRRDLKTGRCSKLDPNILFSFFDTMLLSAHIERVSVSRMRDCFTLISFFKHLYTHVSTFHLIGQIKGPKRVKSCNMKRIYDKQHMVRTLFCPREVKFYKNNVSASHTKARSISSAGLTLRLQRELSLQDVYSYYIHTDKSIIVTLVQRHTGHSIILFKEVWFGHL